ncbi:TPA: hypothetical protein ACRNYL_004954 [Pseudomonas aeruginosa]
MSQANPFIRPDKDYGAVSTDDRLRALDSFNLEQCRAALSVPGLQKTVEKKLHSRIRQLNKEAQELDELVQQFLAGGGQIEKVGYKMRELPDTFVINPMKTPVYNGALAENSSLKAKPAAPRTQSKTEPQRSPAPVPALQPAPGVNPKVWLSRMIAAQALLAAQTARLARELGVSDAELRRLGRRHGMEVFHGTR